jgi:hypothetical protein
MRESFDKQRDYYCLKTVCYIKLHKYVESRAKLSVISTNKYVKESFVRLTGKHADRLGLKLS